METKDNGTKTNEQGFGCCNPENFKEVVEKMSACCSGRGDSPDFSAMKDAMMKNMMEMCCRPASSETEGNAGSQNR